MQKVAIITDSIACLTPEMRRQYPLRIVPFNILFEDKLYLEGVDITPTEAYKLLEKAPDHWKAGPPRVSDYLEVFRELSAQFQAILCITLSSKLSGAYEAACVAKNEAKDELPRITIELLDSMTVTGGEGLIALAAARAAAEGRNLAEVIKTAKTVKDRVSVIVAMETTRHLHRTGRMPKIAAQVISIINIKPILAISGGIVRFTGVARTKERGVNRLLTTMKEKIGASPAHVAVMHADVPDEGERLRQRISSEFNCLDLWLSEFSPVMGYATGKGTLVIAFYPED